MQRSLDCQHSVRRSYDHMLEEPFKQNKDLQELERITSKNCCEVVVKLGTTDFAEDDNKMRNHSFSAAVDFGMPRGKSLKTFGPDPSLMFCASTVDRQGESNTAAGTCHGLRIAGQETESTVDYEGSEFLGDRACNNDKLVAMRTKQNASQSNTVKRSATQIHKWGDTHCRKGREQITISEEGPETHAAAKKIDGVDYCQALHRTGTGRIFFVGINNQRHGVLSMGFRS